MPTTLLSFHAAIWHAGITTIQHPLSTTAVAAANPQASLCCHAGIIPECSILCYFGSLSEDISSVIDGKGGAHGPIKYVLMGVTCFFMITAVVWSTFVVRCGFRMHGRHVPKGALAPSQHVHQVLSCTAAACMQCVM